MSNKYITKIAEASNGISDKLRDPDYARAGLRGVGSGLALGAATKILTEKLGGGIYPKSILGAAGLGIGLTSGFKASVKNQVREQQVHDIKLQGASQRHELHEAKMHKMAEFDRVQTTKDVVNTGVLAGLGGLGTLGVSKIMSRGSKLPSPKGSNFKTWGIGTGVGLVADYAGVKLNHAFNKQVDNKYLNKMAMKFEHDFPARPPNPHVFNTANPGLATKGIPQAATSSLLGKLGKGLAIGGAVLGAGALAHHALKSNNEDNRVQYSYG